MAGIVICALALVCGLVGLALHLLPFVAEKLTRWLAADVWYGVALVLYGVALLWGNIGVIYSHAGLTG